VLITLDTDFANVLDYPPHAYEGIVVLRLHDQSIPSVLSAFSRLLNRLAHASPVRQLWVIDERRTRTRS